MEPPEDEDTDVGRKPRRPDRGRAARAHVASGRRGRGTAAGAGQLSFHPPAADHDPTREPFWTPVMAVAWIVWRTLEAVREAWPEYVGRCWIWRTGSGAASRTRRPTGVRTGAPRAAVVVDLAPRGCLPGPVRPRAADEARPPHRGARRVARRSTHGPDPSNRYSPRRWRAAPGNPGLRMGGPHLRHRR